MSVELFSLAGQTIFQMIGANGAAMLSFESYPADAAVEDQWMDRRKAIRRTREEFEAEQHSLRSAPVLEERERCENIAKCENTGCCDQGDLAAIRIAEKIRSGYSESPLRKHMREAGARMYEAAKSDGSI